MLPTNDSCHDDGENAYGGTNEGFKHDSLPFLTPNVLNLSGRRLPTA